MNIWGVLLICPQKRWVNYFCFVETWKMSVASHSNVYSVKQLDCPREITSRSSSAERKKSKLKYSQTSVTTKFVIVVDWWLLFRVSFSKAHIMAPNWWSLLAGGRKLRFYCFYILKFSFAQSIWFYGCTEFNGSLGYFEALLS